MWAADVNGDKKLDILVGDTINLISPAEGMGEAEFAKRYEKWKEDQSVLIQKAEAEKDEKKQATLQEKMHEQFEKREAFINDDRTGFVWLYLQK